MSFWVYILKCNDQSYYTGHTDNLENRIGMHQEGIVACYTQSRLPVELVYSQEFSTRYEALQMERRIRGWSHAKKEALINNDWKKLSRLAKSKRTSV